MILFVRLVHEEFNFNLLENEHFPFRGMIQVCCLCVESIVAILATTSLAFYRYLFLVRMQKVDHFCDNERVNIPITIKTCNYTHNAQGQNNHHPSVEDQRIRLVLADDDCH